MRIAKSGAWREERNIKGIRVRLNPDPSPLQPFKRIVGERGIVVSIPMNGICAPKRRSLWIGLFLTAALTLAFAGVGANEPNAADLYAPVFSSIATWYSAHVPSGATPPTNVSGAEALYHDMLPVLHRLDAVRNRHPL